MPFECRRGWRWCWCWCCWWQKGVSCKWRQHKFLLSIKGQQAGSQSWRRRVGVEIEKRSGKAKKKKRKNNCKAKEKRSEENRNTKKNRSRVETAAGWARVWGRKSKGKGESARGVAHVKRLWQFSHHKWALNLTADKASRRRGERSSPGSRTQAHC